MKVLKTFPSDSLKSVKHIADLLGEDMKRDMVIGETEYAKIGAQYLDMGKWIDASMVEIEPKTPLIIHRPPNPNKDLILFTFTNYTTYGIQDGELKIKTYHNDYELFISNNIASTELKLQADHQYKYLTFRVHKKELLKYDNTHVSDYGKILEEDLDFSITHFVPRKLQVIMNKMFESENLLGWHSLFQKSLAFELLSDLILLLRNNSPILHSSFDQHQLNLVFQIQSYILKHLESPLNLDQIVKEFNISESKLLKLFKNVLKMSPHQYILSLRLKKAKDSLLYSEQSISQIAYLLGFNSPSHMSTSFKNKFGMTPSEIRKNSGLEKKISYLKQKRFSQNHE